MEDKLNFLLMGRIGGGKSATGNSLLNRRYFKTSKLASQETKALSYSFTMFEEHTLVVVDGPDFISGLSHVKDKIEAAKNIIDQAFGMCYGGIDAFLFVIKFGNKFTAEDKSALEALKHILGDRYLDHVVVVVTYGDLFQSDQEEGEFKFSFVEWCRKQTGEFQQLYEDCKERCVLFNNREKNEEKKRAQIQEIVQLTLGLRQVYDRYTIQRLKHSEEKSEALTQTPKNTETPEILQEQSKVAAILEEQSIPDMAHKNQLKDEVKLNLVLMGKTGHGKSATGNSILQKNVFKASSSSTSVTQEVDYSFTQFEHYILLVVDGPGLADTGNQDSKNTLQCLNAEQQVMNTGTEITNAVKQMDKALVMCYGGVDAFLFVIRFGIRFTDEDQTTLNILKHIFGDSYLDHVIVVVTFGDLFPGEVEKEDLNINFDEWCRHQTGAFRQLYDDCKGRFVLFNNWENNEKKKRAQIQEIVQLALRLRDEYGRYTIQCLKRTERNFQTLMPELKKSQVNETIPEQSIPGMAVEMPVNMDEVMLKFVLIGKTGQGKSETGNSLLNKQHFKTSYSTLPETREVDFSVARFGKYLLLVVDEPGYDISLNKVKDKITAATHMDHALILCAGGIDVFLFVFKFGNRFTAEDKSALDVLKRMFGPRFINHVIVVITNGDLFHNQLQEEGRDVSFHEWCTQQSGVLKTLYEDCKGRFVLFNNREKNGEKKRAQIQEVVQFAEGLRVNSDRYINQHFQDAEEERKKLILELKTTDMAKGMEEQTSLVTSTTPQNKEVKLDFLLMGKTGEGTSGTGNSLLNSKYFKGSATTTSVKNKVRFNFEQFEDNYDFARQIQLFANQIDIFANQVHLFSHQIHLFANQIHRFANQIHLFANQIHLFANQLHRLTNQINLFPKQLHSFAKENHRFASIIHIFARKVVLFDSQNHPFADRIFLFAGEISIFANQICIFANQIHTFANQFQLFANQIHPFANQIKLFANQLHPFANQIHLFANQICKRLHLVCTTYIFLVVDGPGLTDTVTKETENELRAAEKANASMNKATKLMAATDNMNTAIDMCFGSADAFLSVTKFGHRFTAEDIYSLHFLKCIFGPSYLDHMIVVVTCGDIFQGSMEKEDCDISFHGWCFQQEDCKTKLFSLFNIREIEEKKRGEIQDLVQLAHSLQKMSNDRYSIKCVQDAERKREKQILELKASQKIREIQERVSLLTGEIEKLSQNYSESEK